MDEFVLKGKKRRKSISPISQKNYHNNTTATCGSQVARIRCGSEACSHVKQCQLQNAAGAESGRGSSGSSTRGRPAPLQETVLNIVMGLKPENRRVPQDLESINLKPGPMQSEKAPKKAPKQNPGACKEQPSEVCSSRRSSWHISTAASGSLPPRRKPRAWCSGAPRCPASK